MKTTLPVPFLIRSIHAGRFLKLPFPITIKIGGKIYFQSSPLAEDLYEFYLTRPLMVPPGIELEVSPAGLFAEGSVLLSTGEVAQAKVPPL